MGVRPEKHMNEMFKESSMHADAGHPVAVSNFLNAQCMFNFILPSDTPL
jgi:saccharopepsin